MRIEPKRIAVTLTGAQWIALLAVLTAQARPVDRTVAKTAIHPILRTVTRELRLTKKKGGAS